MKGTIGFGLLAVVFATSAVVALPRPGDPGGPVAPSFADATLPAERFEALHAALVPRDDEEAWTTIPWETDLLAARARAAREGKPLLMWIMDGHPLGCT